MAMSEFEWRHLIYLLLVLLLVAPAILHRKIRGREILRNIALWLALALGAALLYDLLMAS